MINEKYDAIIDKHGDKLKKYIVENKDILLNKALENETIKDIIFKKAFSMITVTMVSSIIYGCLPRPIQWVLPEPVFEYFIEHHLEFIVETIFFVKTNSDTIVDLALS